MQFLQLYISDIKAFKANFTWVAFKLKALVSRRLSMLINNISYVTSTALGKDVSANAVNAFAITDLVLLSLL